MLILNKKTSKLAFNSRVLTTLGKLDEQDIEEVNGCSERMFKYNSRRNRI